MTIGHDDDLEKLRVAGRIVARALAAMGAALEPGVTTTGPRRVATKVCSYWTVGSPPTGRRVQPSPVASTQSPPSDRKGSMVKTRPSGISR